MENNLIEEDEKFETHRDNAIEGLSDRIIEGQKEVDSLLNELYSIDEDVGKELSNTLVKGRYKWNKN